MVEQIKNYAVAASSVILLYGGLSVFVIYATEAIKKLIKDKVQTHTWALTVICFLISAAVGFGWYFVVEVTLFQCGVLSLFLFITSTALYKQMKDNDTMIGKWLTSLSAYFDVDKIVELIMKFMIGKISKVGNAEAEKTLMIVADKINEKLKEIQTETEGTK